jgi:cytochrome c553
VAGLTLLGANTPAGTASASQPPIVWGTCSVCHGLDGISPRTSFPDLAGQTKTYLESELSDFRDHTRADHDAKAYMWTMAGNVSGRRIDQIAQYFSALKPPQGATDENPAEVAAGQKIFEQGITPENVPACQTCHGAKATGNEAFPRLAGQHREYLVAQLQAFRSNARNNPIMHPILERVSDAQIRDVAAYLASL